MARSVSRALVGMALIGATSGTLVLVGPAIAQAAPERQTYFICPSVSTNNAKGMWVIGAHGAYYVLIPTEGAGGDKVYLTVPVAVADKAQIPAGWALYKSLPSYPNFVGMAGLLEEGIENWFGSPSGWQEGDPVNVFDNGDGTYDVTNLTLGETITLDHAIPLQSAAIW